MASYKIVLKPSIEKDLRSLPPSVVERVFRRIEALRDDPRPRHSLKLAGAEELHRIRVGEYRVIYGVQKESRQIIVYYVRHRREIYRLL